LKQQETEMQLLEDLVGFTAQNGIPMDQMQKNQSHKAILNRSKREIEEG
jgi:ribosomal protein L14